MFDPSLNRRAVLRLGLASAAAPLLAACQGSSTTTTTTSAAVKRALRVALPEDAALDQARPALTAAFGTATKLDVVPALDHIARVRADAQGGEAAFDLWVVDDALLPELAAGGFALDLSAAGVPDGDLLAPVADMAQWPPPHGPRMQGFERQASHRHAVPLATRVQLLAYRADAFPQPPASWGLLARGARRAAPPAGLALAAATGAPLARTFVPFLLGEGGSLVDDGWQLRFADPPAVTAFARLLTLLSVTVSGVARLDEAGVAEAIATPRAAAALTDSAAAIGGRTLSYAQLPGVKARGALATGLLVVVNAASPVLEDAVALATRLAAPEQQAAFTRAGLGASTEAALADADALRAHPWLAAAAAALPTATARPRGPDWPRIEELLGQRMHEAVLSSLARRTDPRALAGGVLADAVREGETQLTRQGGYYPPPA